MEDRKQALVNLCQEQDKEITQFDVVKAKWGNSTIYGNNVYETPEGAFVVLTDNEATKCMRKDVESLLDDVGINAFSWAETFIDEQSNEQILEDIKASAVSYMEDIAHESGSETSLSRQQEEIIEFLQGRIEFTLEDVQQLEKDGENEYSEDITEFLETYNEKVDEYIEMYAESYSKDYEDNPIDYLKENFGDDMINKAVKEGRISFDFEAMAEYIESVDGRGHLASYDGLEHEQEVDDETFYLYKISETSIEKVVDMAQELIDTYKNGKMESATVESIIDLLEDGFITREDLANRNIDKIGQFFGREYDVPEKDLDFEAEYEEDEYEL